MSISSGGTLASCPELFYTLLGPQHPRNWSTKCHCYTAVMISCNYSSNGQVFCIFLKVLGVYVRDTAPVKNHWSVWSWGNKYRNSHPDRNVLIYSKILILSITESNILSFISEMIFQSIWQFLEAYSDYSCWHIEFTHSVLRRVLLLKFDARKFPGDQVDWTLRFFTAKGPG